MNTLKLRRGRPPKYGRQSRSIALTLPEDVIDRLAAIDADLGRAIVRLVEAQPRQRRVARRTAEVVPFGPHAVIIVTPVRALARLAGVDLIPVGDGRALIALATPHAIPKLELDIRDTLARSDVAKRERQTLEAIADILRDARLSKATAIEERTVIVLQSKRRRSRRPPDEAAS
jgi:hypothetical protein